MIKSVAKAFLGYGYKRQEGFHVRVCPGCPDARRAVDEAQATGLRVEMVLCGFHYQQRLAKRLGESHES
jgi:hypothetical protein